MICKYFITVQPINQPSVEFSRPISIRSPIYCTTAFFSSRFCLFSQPFSLWNHCSTCRAHFFKILIRFSHTPRAFFSHPAMEPLSKKWNAARPSNHFGTPSVPCPPLSQCFRYRAIERYQWKATAKTFPQGKLLVVTGRFTVQRTRFVIRPESGGW